MSKQGLRRERQNLLLLVKNCMAECLPAFHFIMTHIYIYTQYIYITNKVSTKQWSSVSLKRKKDGYNTEFKTLVGQGPQLDAGID